MTRNWLQMTGEVDATWDKVALIPYILPDGTKTSMCRGMKGLGRRWQLLHSQGKLRQANVLDSVSYSKHVLYTFALLLFFIYPSAQCTTLILNLLINLIHHSNNGIGNQ